jgi:hypothetical protein
VSDVVGSGRIALGAFRPCPGLALTPAGYYPPLHAAYGFAGDGYHMASDGVTYYGRPGDPPPSVPTPGWLGHWNFPAEPPPDYYTRHDALAFPGATGDFGSNMVGNLVRLLFVGDGTATLRFGESTYPSGVADTGVRVTHRRFAAGIEHDAAEVLYKVPIETAYGSGETLDVVCSGGAEGLCVHAVDVDIFTGSGHPNYFGWGGAYWVPVPYDGASPRISVRGSGSVAPAP